jgi:hypothetical protein
VYKQNEYENVSFELSLRLHLYMQNIAIVTFTCLSFKNLTGWLFSFQIVNNLDAKEYGKFLEERKKVVEQQLQELKEKKEAKTVESIRTIRSYIVSS